MTMYYVDLSPEADGSHHLHSEDCDELTASTTLRLLGEYDGSASAASVAKILFTEVRTCRKCMRPVSEGSEKVAKHQAQ